MEYYEKKGNLFELSDEYSLVQCIAQIDNWKYGIVADFDKNFKGMKSYCEKEIKTNSLKFPCVIPYNYNNMTVFNLVTKKIYKGKPNYITITKCIEEMALMCQELDIKYLGMPKIGCGLDNLQWGMVREIIQKKFENIDIEIQVRHK